MEHTLQHWLLECLVGDAVQQRAFGNHQGSLKWLVIRPRNVIVFTRKTLVDLDTYRQYHPVIPYVHTHTHTHTPAQTRIATINQKFQHALIAMQTNCIL